MGLSWRFQNLILDSPFAGAKWLRRVDLTRQLFGKTATPPSIIGHGSESTAVQDSTSQIPAADLKMERIRLPSPIFRFERTAANLKMERIRLPSPIFRFQDTAASRDVCCFPLSSSKVVLADQTGRTFLWHADTNNVAPMPNLNKPKSSPISLFVPSADGQSRSYGSLGLCSRGSARRRGCRLQQNVTVAKAQYKPII